MFRNARRKFKRILPGKKIVEINLDEVFLDSSNLPDFDKSQFEGRLEKPIGKKVILQLSLVFALVFAVAIFKIWSLQVIHGEEYANQSELNRLRHVLVFSERGVIYDRNGTELAWNTPSEDDDFASREYIEKGGFSHILGYVNYPKIDSSGFYYQDKFIGVDGIEREYDEYLAGTNGLKIIETNARGEIESESVVRPPQDGGNITLSIDERVQSKMQELIKWSADSSGFRGGAGVIMDVQTGDLLSMVSYPEYDSGILTEGEDRERIASYISSDKKPFLNRAVSGLYTPGSIIKPFIAIGALTEGVISPEKQIFSSGELLLPNPYVEGAFSSFGDWKAHGYTDIREAIAVSSNVYFYQVGGGFEDQEGIGIANIEKYVRLFGIGEQTGVDVGDDVMGTIPSPAWKAEHFQGDAWRVGDTYHTSIGQYGFQVTPLQMTRAIAGIANNGILVKPKLYLDGKRDRTRVNISNDVFDIVKGGMRDTVTEGTAQSLQFAGVTMAAKTGTAEVGVGNKFVNSWIVGFFPYESPKYAFAFMMEHAPQSMQVGSISVARTLFGWMLENTPEHMIAE